MLDQTQTNIMSAHLVCEQRYHQVISTGATFDDLVKVTNQLREEFPVVRMSGPYLLTDTKEVSLELTDSYSKSEVIVPASQAIVEQNNVGW